MAGNTGRNPSPREPNAISHAKHFSRSHDVVIRVYDEAGNVIETHEHTGDFREWSNDGQRGICQIGKKKCLDSFNVL